MNKNLYLAHSENEQGDIHELRKHLLETSQLVEKCGRCELSKQIGQVASLFHDAGKYQAKFQEYLSNGGVRGSVPHAVFGAVLVQEFSRWILPFCIEGHHKGLSDKTDLKYNLLEHKESVAYEEVREKFHDEMRSYVKNYGTIDDDLFKKYELIEVEFFTRYLFSLLTDADWLDTEKHFDPELAKVRRPKQLEIDKMIDVMENKFSKFSKSGEINELRNQVRNEAVCKADLSIGFYSLNLPTGLGKTLTSFYWALLHARKNHLRRIIIVLPFINIIDQTVKILKDLFGEDCILEHHSGVVEEGVTDDEKKYNPKKLASQNWEYPVIVTTTVQFFESLFANKPLQCRKLHNISDSVVIFDEVQTLPKELVQPTITMLKNVHKILSTSFLFCTATQPAFAQRSDFNGIDGIEPLIKYPAEIFKQTKRVEYKIVHDLEPIHMADLIERIMNQKNSVLAIFNTKKETAESFYAIDQSNTFEKVYHLSTSMCAQHRKYIITCIRRNLRKGKRIAVCSTQLIEAGVDFDFPIVFRALAPLESVIQSAGRCNREGKLDKGIVHLFLLANSGWPDQTYKTCADYAKGLILDDIGSLDKHDSFAKYYQQVLRLFVDSDKYNIEEDREKFKFATVAQKYKLIPNITTALLIPKYNHKSVKLYDGLEFKPFLSREDIKQMQPYLVQVYPNFMENYKNLIDIKENGLKVWYGKYDHRTGICPEDLKPDQYIV